MHKKLRIQSALALLIGTTLLVPVASIAQPTESMIRLMDRIARRELKTYKRVINPPRFGYLEPERTIELSFNLRRGQSYGFVAVGDDNADDVDMELVDSSGKILIEDKDDDPSAVITYVPKQKGVYNLRVIMYSCQAQQCQYAVAPYRR